MEFAAYTEVVNSAIQAKTKLIRHAPPGFGLGARWYRAEHDGRPPSEQLPVVRAYASGDHVNGIFYAFRSEWLQPHESRLFSTTSSSIDTAVQWILSHLLDPNI